MKKFIIATWVVVGTLMAGGGIVAAASLEEFTDEKGEYWSDISKAINEWPLNTFSIFNISEVDFYRNTLKMVFGVPDDTLWGSSEVIVAWQDRNERFSSRDFLGLFDGTATGNYEVFYRGNVDIVDGAELEINSLETDLRLMLSTHNLEYGIRSNGGTTIKPEMLSLSKCTLKVQDGQVCRLFYRGPTSEGGASSGLMDYYPVQADYVINETENAADDIENADNPVEVPENPENYSSGDIFDAKNDNSALDAPKTEGQGARRSISEAVGSIMVAGVAASGNNNPDGGSLIINNKENDSEEIIKLIEQAEEGNKVVEEIEVPRLGATAKKIDYKWLFLPVLSLILMAYWWFIAPIWRKSRKNEKKSKKSVDNI